LPSRERIGGKVEVFWTKKILESWGVESEEMKDRPI